jgi:hypothetical protein
MGRCIWYNIMWLSLSVTCGFELTTLAMIGTDCIGTFVVINPTTIWSCAHQKRGRDTSTTNIKENIFLIFKLTFHFLMKLDLNVLHNKIIYFYHAFSLTLWVQIPLRRGVLNTSSLCILNSYTVYPVMSAVFDLFFGKFSKVTVSEYPFH